MLERRLNLFARLKKKYGDAIPKELEDAINLLTWEMMSGDETDGRSQLEYPHFWIRKLEWRSSELADLLAYLSALDIAFRYIQNGLYTKGAFPLARTNRLNCIETQYHDPPTGLPRNFYSTAWLESHPDRLGSVVPTKALNLTLPSNIQQ